MKTKKPVWPDGEVILRKGKAIGEVFPTSAINPIDDNWWFYNYETDYRVDCFGSKKDAIRALRADFADYLRYLRKELAVINIELDKWR